MAHDERVLFTMDELSRAMEQVLPKEEAAEFAASVYPGAADSRPYGAHEHWSEDTLDLLSLVSDECAEKVRMLLELDHASAAERRTRARQRFHL